jgi:hypothetical protein
MDGGELVELLELYPFFLRFLGRLFRIPGGPWSILFLAWERWEWDRD